MSKPREPKQPAVGPPVKKPNTKPPLPGYGPKAS